MVSAKERELLPKKAITYKNLVIHRFTRLLMTFPIPVLTGGQKQSMTPSLMYYSKGSIASLLVRIPGIVGKVTN